MIKYIYVYATFNHFKNVLYLQSLIKLICYIDSDVQKHNIYNTYLVPI